MFLVVVSVYTHSANEHEQESILLQSRIEQAKQHVLEAEQRMQRQQSEIEQYEVENKQLAQYKQEYVHKSKWQK